MRQKAKNWKAKENIRKGKKKGKAKMDANICI
jgi:hypothetical protein